MNAVTEYWYLEQDFAGGVDRAVYYLNAGEPIVFPTETVYGIGAKMQSHSATEKIYSIKGRPREKPLSAYISCAEQAERVARDIPESFYKIAEYYLPGPVAVVLKRDNNVPEEICGGRDTIAIRIPDNEFVLSMLNESGEIIAGTSANISAKESAKTAYEAFKEFRGKVPLVIDGGESLYGIESTVIDLSGDKPAILRNGMVTCEELEQAAGCRFEVADRNPAPEEFYLPDAPLYMLRNMRDMVELQNEKENILLLSNFYYPKSLINADTRKLNVRDFYDHLQEADIQGYGAIAVLCDSKARCEKMLSSRIYLTMLIQRKKSN